MTDVVYTVEDVVKEIRDIKTREFLNVTLYTLKFKEPSTEAIRFGKRKRNVANELFFVIFFLFLVTNYAKKTGDYAFLSAVDLRLLALTYQLYEENVGVEKLNLEPKVNVSECFCEIFLSRFSIKAAVMSTITTTGNAGMKLAGFVVPKQEVCEKDFVDWIQFDGFCLGERRKDQ